MTSTNLSLITYLIFIVIGLLSYLVFPKKVKWVSILILSLVCTFILTAYWIIFLFAAIIVSYFFGKRISYYNERYNNEKINLDKDERKNLKNKYKHRQKILIFVSVVLLLLILDSLKYFHIPWKYVNNAFEKGFVFSIVLPMLGVSYYMLVSISYLVDIYRGKYESEKNIFKLALFIGYFPTQIEGPFTRYDELSPMLFKTENPTYDDIADGFYLIILGLFKKIFIADRINIIVSEVYNRTWLYDGKIVIFTWLIYAIQLYADFSGFIDIARGASKMFGIRLNKNFDKPFASRSVSEFWRRWHITLGAWLKDYVFYPIALSKPMMKLSKKLHGRTKEWLEKIIINAIPLFFVWLCCGIWHGSGLKFIVYGMYFFTIIMLEMLFEPLKKILFKKDNVIIHTFDIIRTFIFVVIGLSLFRSGSLMYYYKMLKQLNNNGIFNLIKADVISKYDFKMMCIGIASIIFIGLYSITFKNKPFKSFNPFIKIALAIILILVIIIFGAYGSSYQAVDPMYALY